MNCPVSFCAKIWLSSLERAKRALTLGVRIVLVFSGAGRVTKRPSGPGVLPGGKFVVPIVIGRIAQACECVMLSINLLCLTSQALAAGH